MGSAKVLIKVVGRHVALLAFLTVPVGVVAGQGCTLADDLCDVFCECQLCNDRQEDDCQIVVQASIDLADAYECTDEAETYWDCARNKNDCDNNLFSIDNSCDDEHTDFLECVDDNSDIIELQVSAAQGMPQQGSTAQGGAQTVCACACTCTMCVINSATRTCLDGEGGCESCDVVCNDACLADATCGAPDTSLGGCGAPP